MVLAICVVEDKLDISSLLHEIQNHIRLKMVFVIVLSIGHWFSSSPEEPVVSIL